MFLLMAAAVSVLLFLYYWMNMKKKNFPPGKVNDM
jgi:hypothetical protein